MMKKTLALAILVCSVSGGAALASEAGPAVFDPAMEGVSGPALIASSRVVPDYPPAALQARYDATVVARAMVDATGAVSEVEVVDSSRAKLGFERSVIKAVKQWRFEPAQRDGENVASWTWVRLHFFPPERGAAGAIAADFPELMLERGSDWIPAGRGAGGGITAGLLEGAANASNRTAVSPDQAKRVATYGKPPVCNGCLYNRESLIPASTRPLASPVGGE